MRCRSCGETERRAFWENEKRERALARCLGCGANPSGPGVWLPPSFALHSARGLTLTLDVDGSLDEWVADERKVKQVVINLLSNAVKFTPAGGTVTIRARRQQDAVEIAVVDTGVGIAPQDQALVFEEFRQAGGDYLRWTPPLDDAGTSFLFHSINRGKKSVALDLKSADGKAG